MKSIKEQIENIPSLYWKILYFLLATVVCFVEAEGRSDFTIYQLAANTLFHHQNPYAQPYIDGYYYYYSLLFLYLTYPFQFLDAYWATFLWLFLNACFLYAVMHELSRLLNIQKHNSFAQSLFYASLLIFNIRTIRENFHSAQVTVFILFLMIYSLKFLLNRQRVFSAFLLALAINIKLLALPLLLYYWYIGHIRTVFYTIILLILFYTMPILWMGDKFYGECMQQWWLLVNPNNDKHLIDVEERSFHSITTLISTLFLKNPPDVYALPVRRYVMELSVEQVKLLIQFVRFVFVISVLGIIRRKPFHKPPDTMVLFYEFSYVIALIPLIFPHQQHYAFLMQMPAISILIYQLIFQNKRLTRLDKWMMAGIFLCFNLKILLGVWDVYYEHYKILTYGGILTIVLLWKWRGSLPVQKDNFACIE